MTKIGYEEALARVAAQSWDMLYEDCHESYKDFYGCRGYHMSTYTKEELVNWFAQHYMWDNDEQFWRNQVPFHEEDYSKEPWAQDLWYDTSKELM